MKLKYLALCLVTLSCTQVFSVVLRETSPIFDNASKVAEWLKEKGIEGGFWLGRNKDNRHRVCFDCNAVYGDKNKGYINYIANFLPISKIIAMLPNWLASTDLFSSPKYQASRSFTKQFTFFGLLNWMGVRKNEKNRFFDIQNAGFEEPGIAPRGY